MFPLFLRSARARAPPALVARCFTTGKDLRFSTEARNLMARGVDSLADAVEVTLGPKGRNVVIEKSFGSPQITKDGVTVAKNIEFKDKHMNLGAQLVRSVANDTNNIAGDGTTTATVLTRAIYSEGIKAVAAGMNPMDLKRGIDLAVEKVLDELRVRTQPISTKEEISSVATISANGDEKVGHLIAEAMEKVGREGTITVSDGKTIHDELDIVEGMKFDRGFISPYFVTDPKAQKVEFENAFVLAVEKKVSTVASILPILEGVMKSQRPLLIIAEDVESEALATLVVNKLRLGIKVCAVKAPGFGDRRKANLEDISIMTSAQLVSSDLDMKLEDVTLNDLGTAKKITVTKDDTIILDGGGEKKSIEERCDMLRDSLDAATSEYDKEKIHERLAKLSGGVAVIKVGGVSEVEVSERKDRFTDALNATRAAVEEGIVPGGGTALLLSSRDALKDVKGANFDQDVGIDIVRKALRVPCYSIARNAGVEGSVVVERLLNHSGDKPLGYNAQTGEYTDLVKAGIIDPTKVQRTALEQAASVAGLMATTECMVVDNPKEESADMAAMAAAAGGGMGGGMGF
ncbi:Chaperonin CPN60-2, mitochondrial [Gracilariopsis chorda]|uniref:Chaperonin CPN60-2, mitochondrial n=1 Tax=Gracilariopsis chorda TaxID=448386 RepID=A0A2V3IKE6_9FLOR|nr:Chaperonin CPN60-2, mitochondrial [Gracilariopsis chorda]|eukprot:PXF42547.1 Chaperonin CPN60-2, mitochondrial [Gracilariopsis chorda]